MYLLMQLRIQDPIILNKKNCKIFNVATIEWNSKKEEVENIPRKARIMVDEGRDRSFH